MFGIENNKDSDSSNSRSGSSSSGGDSTSNFNSDDEECWEAMEWHESIVCLYKLLLQEVLQREGHANTVQRNSFKLHTNNSHTTSSTRFCSTAA